MLHVFVDESGDLGFNFEKGATEYMVIGFAFFPNENYKIGIDNIKSAIESKSRTHIREIKFSASSSSVRRALLGQLVAVNGKFGYVFINKHRVYDYLQKHPSNNYLYNKLIYYLIENLIQEEQIKDHITVYIDERSKNKEIKKSISRYLQDQINPILSPYSLYVRFERSHNSRGIQCVDSICGSVYRMVAKNDAQYYEIIKNNFVVEREIFKR